MSEDRLTEQLRQLRPADAFDRDGLLFAAGRASAGSARGWKIATLLLAVTQATTLALVYYIRPSAPLPAPAVPPPVPVVEPPSPEPTPPLAFTRRPADLDSLPTLAPSDNLVPAAPPLSVLSAYRDPTGL